MYKGMFGWLKKNGAPRWEHPDIETPLTDEDVKRVSSCALNCRQNWIDEDDWSLITDEDGILLEERQIPGSDLTCIRSRSIIKNVEFQRLLKESFKPTFEQRKEIYDELISHKIVKEINDDLHIAYSQYKAPFGVTNRDFLAVWSHHTNADGSHLISVQSINDQNTPFDDKYVRGVCQCGILLIPNYNEKDDVLCITIDHIDPKGSVPSFVINMYKTKVMDRVKKMRHAFKKN